MFSFFFFFFLLIKIQAREKKGVGSRTTNRYTVFSLRESPRADEVGFAEVILTSERARARNGNQSRNKFWTGTGLPE